jgi:hypothetical protein
MTTNKRVLEGLAGPTDAIELIGRPFDLAVIVARVGAALAALDAGGGCPRPATHPHGLFPSRQ